MKEFAFSLRPEEPRDHAEVEHLTREAFWNVHEPGCVEHYLLHILRDSPGYLPDLHYLAVTAEQIVGSIVYSRCTVVADSGERWPLLTFGPLSVLPAYQRRGIGSALIGHTLALARERGERAIILFGNPTYYGRFGFRPSADYSITLPDGSSFDAFQTLELYPGALAGIGGRYYHDEAFEGLDAERVDAFDASFPPKIKQRLPGQLR